MIHKLINKIFLKDISNIYNNNYSQIDVLYYKFNTYKRYLNKKIL